MASAWMAFRECGTMAYVALFFGAIGFGIGLAAAVVAVIAKGRAGMYVGAVGMLFGVASLAAGAGGMLMGRSTIDRALADESVDPTMRERIRVEGYHEAGQCIAVGGANAATPLVLGSLAIFVAFVRKRPQPA